MKHTQDSQWQSPTRWGQFRLAQSVVACCGLAIWLGVIPGAAQDEALRFERAYERFDQFVAQFMRDAGAPGLALALTSRQGLLRASTYGFADFKARAPVRPETRFQIGSISKSFTAIALLQLREAGKFDPAKPIADYVPWFKIQSTYAPLTGHDLLTHTAGLPRDRDDIPSSLYQAAALRERSTGYAPRTRFAYSNIGYQVLGYLLEEVARQPYAEVIRQRILEPLGMMSSDAAITHDTRKQLAVGYIPLYDDRPSDPSQPLIEAPWFEYAAGDGSISATANDLAAYLRMLLNRGAGPNGPIISEESFRLLTQRAIVTDAKQKPPEYYGYGIGTREVEGHTVIGHDGGMIGYSSSMLGDLDDGLGVVVFVNGPGDPHRVADFGLKALRAALHQQDLPALPEPETPTKAPKAADYAGVFTSPEGKKLTLVAEGEHLMLLHNGQQLRLEKRGEDRFWANHPDFALFLLTFGRDKEKVVEAAYGSVWYANERYSGPRSFDSPKDWLAYPGHFRSQDPWFNNFRVVLRKGKLWLVVPEGEEMPLKPVDSASFQLGEEPTAERIRFDTVVNGKALRAELSGKFFYRSFTP